MRRTNRQTLAPALAVLALVAAACGGATDPAPEAEGATAEGAAAEPASEADDADTAASDDHDDSSDDAGMDGHAEAATQVAVDRTVEVEMSEFAFVPGDLSFEAGETVRFVFSNVGEAPHEAVLGDMHVQEEHEAAMAEAAGGHGDGHDEGGHHGDIPTVTVEPGETGEFVHTFTEAGDVMLGCHLPGHWNAGMQATLDVAA